MESVINNKIQSYNVSEVIVAIAVVVILTVMIIPLPKTVLDFFLATNITFSVIILLISMYINNPLEFSIFPTLLLVTTLFRLSLNIASTRLILLNGHEGPMAAGRVIMSFGKFVVAGNYVIGFIIFLILVIVNFVVITKGATRIAEVAARFTLDAMPGKQMSIDADLNAGLIDEEEARRRRRMIAREADFNGAMDGAAKFVRGDAIAGIIITLINIIGGLVIGVFQKKMSIIDAAHNYTLLTIGDGLVSQIPALIISTSAGIIVSRSASETAMGIEFSEQLFSYKKAIYLAAFTIFLFGLIPGLPHIPFIFLALIVGLGGYLISYKRELTQVVAEEEVKEKEGIAPEPVEDLLFLDPIEIEVGYGLISLVDKEQGGELLDRIRAIRRQFATDMGIIIPPIHIRDNLQLEPTQYQVLIKGVCVGKGNLMLNYYLAMDPGNVVKKVKGIETKEPVFNLPALWINESQKEEAKLAGYTVVDNVTIMATHLTEILKRHAPELLTRQDVQKLLDNLAKTYPKVVEELVPNQLSLGGVQKVLQNLLEERISIRDMLTIVETLADYAPITKDPDILTEYVRHKLARSIITPYLDENNELKALILGKDIEEIIENGIKSTEHGNYLSIDPQVVDRIIYCVNKNVEKVIVMNLQPVILTSPAVRRYFKKLISNFIPSITIFSQSEIPFDVKIKAIGEIKLTDES